MNSIEKEQVILGTLPSKSNSYKIITINGHSSLAKSAALKAYEKEFYLQCNKYRGMNYKGLFELYADVYFTSDRQDLDNAAKGLLDCLQIVKAIDNDRHCIGLYMRKFKDKNNPRVEFTIVKQ